MKNVNQPQDATLLDLLIDGFEKNEMLGGYHMRTLPLPDDAAAAKKFAELSEEARRWKGDAQHAESTAERQHARWADLEIRRAGRGIMVRVKAPRFGNWWNLAGTWAGDPMKQVDDWIDDDAASERARM